MKAAEEERACFQRQA